MGYIPYKLCLKIHLWINNWKNYNLIEIEIAILLKISILRFIFLLFLAFDAFDAFVSRDKIIRESGLEQ